MNGPAERELRPADRLYGPSNALQRGGGVFMLTPRCLETSPYVFPGKRHALSSNMLSDSVSHQFTLFPDPILLDTGASGAPQLSFLLIPFSDNLHRSGKVEHSPAQ